MPIAIFVVESHELIRTGIEFVCRDQADFSIIGHAASLAEAAGRTLATPPDVLIADLRSPDDSNAEALLAWQATHSHCKILAFTSNDNSQEAAAWIERGVSGYISKDAAVEELSLAIRILHQGRIFISHSRHTATLFPAIDSHGKSLAPIEIDLSRARTRSPDADRGGA